MPSSPATSREALSSADATPARAGGTACMDAFVDGYHLGLLVTILLLAGGVVVSYLTLRPRVGAAPEPGAAVAELTPVDELASELMVAEDAR